MKKHIFDAIVIGSGMSGGWAAKELCEKGLKTIVLERGRHVEHVVDYPSTLLNPWELEHGGKPTLKMLQDAPIQSQKYNFDETTANFFVKDVEHPYNQVKPYAWFRAYQTGGRSLLWGRQTYRWSNYDFDGNARDGIAIDWPVRYPEIAPWYSYVEKFVGISGNQRAHRQVHRANEIGFALSFVPDLEALAIGELLDGSGHIVGFVVDDAIRAPRFAQVGLRGGTDLSARGLGCGPHATEHAVESWNGQRHVCPRSESGVASVSFPRTQTADLQRRHQRATQ